MASDSSRNLSVNIALKSNSFQSQIKSVNKDIRNFKNEADLAMQSTDKFGSKQEQVSSAINSYGKALDSAKSKVKTIRDEIDKQKETIEKCNKANEEQKKTVSDLQKQLEEAKMAFGDNSKEVKDLEESLKKATKELKSTDSALYNATNKLKDLENNLTTAEKEANTFEKNIKDLNDELDNVDNEGVEDLNESFDDLLDKGSKLTIVGEGLQNIGDKASEAGEKVLGMVGDLAKAGMEYDANVAGIEFTMKNLDSTTQEMINKNAELAKSIGLSNLQYVDGASKLATYFNNMGMSTDATNELTNSSMNLIADLAAITDMPFDDAMGRFKSGLMGNYEALDAFNINVSASSLESSAFVQSLGKTWNQLSDNEKMMAVYNEIVRQSASAQGLASQEADSASAKYKLLQTQLDELKGTIGEQLIPTLEPLIAKISDVIGKITEWVQQNPELTTAILTIVGAIGGFLLIAGNLLSTIGSVSIGLGALSGAISGVGGLMPWLSASILPIIGVIAAVIAIVGLLAGGIASNFDGIKLAVENLKSKFSENFGNIQETFNNTWSMLQDIYNTVVQPLFDGVGKLIEGVVNFIADCMPGISTAFQLVFDIVKTVWDSVGKPVADFIMDIFKKVVDWFVANLPWLSSVFNDVMGKLKAIWESVGKPLFDFIKVFISNVITILKPIISMLGTAFQGAFNLIKGAWAFLSPIFDIIIAIIGKLVSVASEKMSKFSDFITSAMETVLTPIQWVIDKLSDLFSWLGSVGEKAGGVLSKLNPFSWFKSIDIPDTIGTVGVGVDTSGISTLSDGLGNIALSGQYYNANTRASVRAGEVLSSANNVASSVNNAISLKAIDNISKKFSDEIKQLKSENTNMMNSFISAISQMTKAMQEYVLQDHIVVENQLSVQAEFNADGKRLASAIAPYQDKAVNRFNKLALR